MTHPLLVGVALGVMASVVVQVAAEVATTAWYELSYLPNISGEAS